MQYQQLKLIDNFRKYLEASLLSEYVLRMGIKPSPYQKSYEINRQMESYVVDFKGSNKQFSFMETSLVYCKCKNNQHNSVYDSYNLQSC